MSENQKKLALIATKGTLDWAYPPFILASTAAALGYEAQIFFTFYGLNLLRKDLNLKVSSLGNPGMPMPAGMDKWFPTLGQAMPGMENMMTMMMKKKIKDKGVASVEELREMCIDAEVEMIACQMTVDLFDFKREDLIDEIELGGAASFLEFAGDSVIVAHNKSFDLGFLNSAAVRLGYPKLPNRSLDTVALARRLVRSEVRSLGLRSLAAHFRSPVTPTHRALDDARATVHVLHGLLERAGTLHVTHL